MKVMASKWVPSDAAGCEGNAAGSATAGRGLVLILFMIILLSGLGGITAFLLGGGLMAVLLSWWVCGFGGALAGGALSYVHSSRGEGARDAADRA